MLCKFKRVKISGISTVVPPDEINIYDEAQYYDNNIKKIDRMRKMVGFWKRRVVEKGVTASDLAICAAENLIADLNIDKESIDALIFVVQKLDYAPPVNAYFIHNKLGLSGKCIATDVNQGCAGWVFGLYMASQMIESRTHKKILLLNGDTPSVGIDKSDRNSAPIFGDGGVATLIEYSEDENISYYNINTVSSGYEAIIGPFTGMRFSLDIFNDEDFELLNTLRKEKLTMPTGMEVPLLGGYMDGIAVFDFTINSVPKNINELLNYANMKVSDIPVLCLHQANKQIIQQVANIAGFDVEKAPYKAFENFGNNTMCSIPTTLSLLDKEIKRKNILCCGYGNGLVCVSSILNLENTYISEVNKFVKPDYIMTRDEYIDYWRKKIKGEPK